MRRPWPLLLCFTCFVRPAHAGDALKVELRPHAMVGKGQPGLLIHAQEDLDRLVLDVRRSSDGKRFSTKAGPISNGDTHRFDLPVKTPGPATFEGTLSVRFGEDQSGSMPIRVDVELLPRLKVRVAPEDVDVKAMSMKLSTNRPIKKVQVELMSDAGKSLGTSEEAWDDAVGGAEKVSTSWKQHVPGTVMKIAVKAYDAAGFFGAVELYPWQVDIPHEDVLFATGSHDIAKPESAKLEDAYKALSSALAKYGKVAKVQLFIAGHTDTVGDADSNRALSNRRARSIGRWFKKRGVRVRISYAGFGEDRLLVKTPDNTDKAENRRAEYIVAVQAPALSQSVRWKRLD